MRLIADLVMTTSLSAAYSPSRSPLAEDAGLEQHAVLDDQLVAQVGLERGEQLLDGEGGQEAEPAQVDAEDRPPPGLPPGAPC